MSRIPAELLGVYALSSVLVAMLGLYAVLAYSVIERHREFALRMALGSTRAGIFRLVLRGSALTAAVGLLTGGLGVHCRGAPASRHAVWSRSIRSGQLLRSSGFPLVDRLCFRLDSRAARINGPANAGAAF